MARGVRLAAVRVLLERGARPQVISGIGRCTTPGRPLTPPGGRPRQADHQDDECAKGQVSHPRLRSPSSRLASTTALQRASSRPVPRTVSPYCGSSCGCMRRTRTPASGRCAGLLLSLPLLRRRRRRRWPRRRRRLLRFGHRLWVGVPSILAAQTKRGHLVFRAHLADRGAWRARYGLPAGVEWCHGIACP
jgi:hypothetical protein